MRYASKASRSSRSRVAHIAMDYYLSSASSSSSFGEERADDGNGSDRETAVTANRTEGPPYRRRQPQRENPAEEASRDDDAESVAVEPGFTDREPEVDGRNRPKQRSPSSQQQQQQHARPSFPTGEGEGEDDDVDNDADRERISTLRLEEKIVALMNRIWILETENSLWRTGIVVDAAAGETRKEESVVIVGNLYRDPHYAPPGASGGVGGEADDGDSTALPPGTPNCGTAATAAAATTTTPTKTTTATMDPTPPILRKKTLEQLDRRSAAVTKANDRREEREHEHEQDQWRWRDETASLRKSLAVSEAVRERMRIAMVTLETRDKLRSELVDELTRELERAREKEGGEEDETASRKSEDDAREDDTADDDGRSVVVFDHDLPSSAEAGRMITDLSRELRLALEREGSLRTDLDAARTEIHDRRKRTSVVEDRNAAAARSAARQVVELSRKVRDGHQESERLRRERGALGEQVAELEALNAGLVRELRSLEARFRAFAEEENNARPRRRRRRGGFPGGDDDDDDDDNDDQHEYVSALEARNRRHKKEITGLKDRLNRSETAFSEFVARISGPSTFRKLNRPLHARPPPNTRSRSRSSSRSVSYRESGGNGVNDDDDDDHRDDSLRSQSETEGDDSLWKNVVVVAEGGSSGSSRRRRRRVTWSRPDEEDEEEDEIESGSDGHRRGNDDDDDDDDDDESPLFFHDGNGFVRIGNNNENKNDDDGVINPMFPNRVEV